VPVLETLRAWLDETRPQILPGSALGEALAYLDNHWRGLVRYCDDGRYEMNINGVENAIRPFCIGRRGWLFSDTVAGAKSSANLYSLIQTAKANRLESYAYLRRVFTELPKATSLADVEALLPLRIAPSQIDVNTHSARGRQPQRQGRINTCPGAYPETTSFPSP
jgi:transposase